MLPGDILKNIEGNSHKHLLCLPLSYARTQPCMSLRWATRIAQSLFPTTAELCCYVRAAALAAPHSPLRVRGRACRWAGRREEALGKIYARVHVGVGQREQACM